MPCCPNDESLMSTSLLHFNIITLFPDLIDQYLKIGVVGGGFKRGLVSYKTINPRDFTHDAHKSVDDRPFGGGDGMVMMPEPLEKVFETLLAQGGTTIYVSPQGRLLDQALTKSLSQKERLNILCGRYSGVDQRILNKHVDLEISIGDYVLSGGELPALVLVDAISRQVPGVLGHHESAQQDSFEDGLLEAPLFTKPRLFNEQEVPSVLMSGHHGEIAKWRKSLGILVTMAKRPDLITADIENRPDFHEAVRLYKTLDPEMKSILGLSTDLGGAEL